jgi:hypothetical protein
MSPDSELGAFVPRAVTVNKKARRKNEEHDIDENPKSGESVCPWSVYCRCAQEPALQPGSTSVPLLEPTGLELALVAAHRLLLLELVGAECGR